MNFSLNLGKCFLPKLDRPIYLCIITPYCRCWKNLVKLGDFSYPKRNIVMIFPPPAHILHIPYSLFPKSRMMCNSYINHTSGRSSHRCFDSVCVCVSECEPYLLHQLCPYWFLNTSNLSQMATYTYVQDMCILMYFCHVDKSWALSIWFACPEGSLATGWVALLSLSTDWSYRESRSYWLSVWRGEQNTIIWVQPSMARTYVHYPECRKGTWPGEAYA